jgi:arylsulfatase A-like enzyme/Tfp pilus assembly protein PilF
VGQAICHRPKRDARLAACVLVSVAAVAALTAGGCGGAKQPDRAGVVEPEAINVVLVTLDTLRTDRISCYGADRLNTPNIDRFAAEGVRFEAAATTVPFTLPAHSSILTGLYPTAHGVRENVGYTLDERIPTVAETLSRNGWATAGFVSAFVLDARWGIGRGFDRYFDDFDLSGFDTPNLSSVQRRGDITLAEAVRWLDQRPPDLPFFLWLHLYDPHDPYEPPEPWATQYAGRPYDGEVAFTDSLVGELRQALDERDLLGSTMVILTSDHGEGLGDHGETSHGFFLYDTTVRVGMIVRMPGGDPAGRVIDTAVSHVDLVPTILDVAGVEPPQPLHGESLLPLIEGGGGEPRRGVYSESLYPLLHYGWAPLRALRTDSRKLISAPRPEVFDVRADPGEEHDLSAAQPAVLAELESELAGLRSAIEPAESASKATPDLDPHTLAQLQALGYAAGQGGVSAEQERDRPRADPKDRIAVHRTIMRAQSLLQRDPAAAESALRGVLEVDPDVLDAQQMLGQLALMGKEYDHALGYFRRALELQPDHANSLMGMASAYRSMGRFDDAIAGYRRLLEVQGHSTGASLAIADIEVERGRFDEASAVIERAVEHSDAPALLHNRLGELRVRQGRLEESLALFEQAAAENDKFANPHFNLAVLAEERGQIEEAVAHYEKAVELAPTYFQALFNLGRLIGQLGRVDRQQELWERAVEANPDFVQGHYRLAKLLMDEGDLARAEELARAGIRKDPDGAAGPLGYYVLADILNRTGRTAEAADAVAAGRRIQAAVKGAAKG